MKRILLYLLAVLLLLSCKKDLDELEKYTPPPWLKGKLYSQIEAQEGLELFAEALRITGLDTIINTSGLFTVFAPDNEAMERYLQENEVYGGSLENIPPETLRSMVSYHIVQNSWSIRQLSSLNLNGWIDPSEEDVRSRAFKKESIFRPGIKEYHVEITGEDELKISDDETYLDRKVYSASRKFVPVFYQEYFETYGLPLSDYAFFFNRPFDAAIHFGEAKVLNQEEIPAENGYVYIIDRFIEPLPTAEDLLAAEYPGYSYSSFLSLLYEFPEFTANLDATYQQEGADEGLDVDTLFDLTFPELAVNFNNEITHPSGSDILASIQYHNGVFAPSNSAFEAFLDKYVRGKDQWTSLEDMPRNTKRIIANSYLVRNVIYGSDITRGFQNAENDLLFLEEADFIQKDFASNASFVGLDRAIVPRAFSSISAPVYLRRGFFTFMTAIEETNVLDALKRQGQNYTFFVIPDEYGGMLRDSSLHIKEKNNNISFEAYNRSTLKMENLPNSDLRKMILNHLGLTTPRGVASLEYVKNMAGNYIVFDNLNDRVGGSAPSTYGFNGDSVIEIEALFLDEDTDNGHTFEIPTWFSFSRNPMNLLIFELNPDFMLLLEKAGMAKRIIGDEFELLFQNQGASYTAFIPSPEALTAYNTDTLSNGELEQFLRNHFVPNKMIFTDGNMPSGRYQTSNAYSAQTLHIETSADLISLRDKHGEELSRVEPYGRLSNAMTTSGVGNTNSPSEWNFITTGVVHELDTVLVSNIIY